MRIVLILLFVLTSQFMAISQSIEDFSLPNVTDGSAFSLSSLKSEKAVVIIFFSGKCAYSAYYLDRILILQQKFLSQGVKFLFINSNNGDYIEEESIEGMKSFVRTNNLSFPYLADKEKTVKNLLHATRTPEVFVLQPSNSLFRVVYKGAIDDNPQSARDVSHAYLEESLVNLLNKKKIEMNQTRPVGCLIK